MSKYQLITLQLGMLETNCYILICEETKQAAVIDPGANGAMVKRKVEAAGGTVAAIINTHGHWDHIGGNEELQQLTNAPLYIHTADAEMLNDASLSLAAEFRGDGKAGHATRLLQDGDEIEVGKLRLKVLHTPGHTPGGISLVCEDLLFSGDTLFCQSIGRTDFPGGSQQALLRGLHEKLAPLDPELQVLPGHGPSSRLGYEVQCNPFFKLPY